MIDWLALVIGNTRWHWGWFRGSSLLNVWHTPHLIEQSASGIRLSAIWGNQAPPPLLNLLNVVALESLEIWAVSVVPLQARYLDSLPTVRWIQHFPLKGVYPTMGLDRVATLWGASQRYGWPVFVIDCGTALTFTGGAAGTFVGGAILLGMRSHLAALHHHTAALPIIEPPAELPLRWAEDTPGSIQSGVIYTLLASIHSYIQSWQQRYPATTILFTGGDGAYLHQLYTHAYQTQQNQVSTDRTWFEPNLMFWGIAAYRNEATRAL